MAIPANDIFADRRDPKIRLYVLAQLASTVWEQFQRFFCQTAVGLSVCAEILAAARYS